MKIITFICALSVSLASSFSTPAGSTPADLGHGNVVPTLNRQNGGHYNLAASRATLTVDPRFWVLTGPDAAILMQSTDPANAAPGVEAVIGDYDTQAIVAFQSVRDGFVTFDDWKTADADRMMADAIGAARPAQNGTATLRITGWHQKPYLDSVAKTVHWAVEGVIGDQPVLNVVTLVFGRYGYERLTWTGPAGGEPWPLLKAAADSFAFTPGARYQDAAGGDARARYGVGALVATAIGAETERARHPLAADTELLRNAGLLALLLPAALWWSVRRGTRRPRPAKALDA